MSPPFSVRPALRADVPAVAEMALALGRQHQGYDPARFRLEVFGSDEAALRRAYEAFFADAVERADSVVLLARDDAAVFGYVFGRIEAPSFVDLSGESAWIHDLWVREDGRARGVGRTLLGAALEALREKGGVSPMLSVAPKNEAARALFERSGFVPTMIEHRLAEAAQAPATRPVTRPTRAADLPALKSVIDATGLFPGDALDEMTAPFFAGTSEDDRWITLERGRPIGVAYYAPERLTAGTWNLYLIAVEPRWHGRGLGAQLLDHVERELADRGARILLVETSGLPSFARTRGFYVARGYDVEARIRDFYQAGDDKIVFRKALTAPNQRERT